MARRRKRRLTSRTVGLLVLDSGALTKIASDRTRVTRSLWRKLTELGWRSCAPSVTLAETITGKARHDAAINLLLNQIDDIPDCDEAVARAAGPLRFAVRRPRVSSAVDAVVAAIAEAHQPSIVLTTNPDDLAALLVRAERAVVIGV